MSADDTESFCLNFEHDHSQLDKWFSKADLAYPIAAGNILATPVAMGLLHFISPATDSQQCNSPATSHHQIHEIPLPALW